MKNAAIKTMCAFDNGGEKEAHRNRNCALFLYDLECKLGYGPPKTWREFEPWRRRETKSEKI